MTCPRFLRGPVSISRGILAEFAHVVPEACELLAAVDREHADCGPVGGRPECDGAEVAQQRDRAVERHREGAHRHVAVREVPTGDASECMRFIFATCRVLVPTDAGPEGSHIGFCDLEIEFEIGAL